VRVLRDRKAKVPHAANSRLKAIRYVFKWAMEAEHLRANPARDVSLIRAPSDGHHTWTVEELEQFEGQHPIGSKARLALDLLMYTGGRMFGWLNLAEAERYTKAAERKKLARDAVVFLKRPEAKAGS
jgi:site-specific recombinase XerD